MKEIIEKCKIMEFTCDMCCCFWKSNEYKIIQANSKQTHEFYVESSYIYDSCPNCNHIQAIDINF